MMLRWIPILMIVGLIVYLVAWTRRQYLYGGGMPKKITIKPFTKEMLRESWIQIYETASKEEADQLRAHFEELEIQSITFEQGKKNIEGKNLPGIGFAVPKTQMSRAQNLLFRFLDRKK
ncbi:MAG: hypothetical protein HY586_02770 [Candidatus Omnitrophica bacterium]|nr:hypothetical protein [Candidatus Omnitrophota bacterium]